MWRDVCTRIHILRNRRWNLRIIFIDKVRKIGGISWPMAFCMQSEAQWLCSSLWIWTEHIILMELERFVHEYLSLMQTTELVTEISKSLQREIFSSQSMLHQSRCRCQDTWVYSRHQFKSFYRLICIVYWMSYSRPQGRGRLSWRFNRKRRWKL